MTGTRWIVNHIRLNAGPKMIAAREITEVVRREQRTSSLIVLNIAIFFNETHDLSYLRWDFLVAND